MTQSKTPPVKVASSPCHQVSLQRNTGQLREKDGKRSERRTHPRETKDEICDHDPALMRSENCTEAQRWVRVREGRGAADEGQRDEEKAAVGAADVDAGTTETHPVRSEGHGRPGTVLDRDGFYKRRKSQ